MTEVNIARPREGVGGRSPRRNQPARGEGVGGRSPRRNQPARGEGVGGRSPPKNNYFHSGVVRYAHDRLR